jgi:hypothetical protein
MRMHEGEHENANPESDGGVKVHGGERFSNV